MPTTDFETSQRYVKAISAFLDAARQDPNSLTIANGSTEPHSLIYHTRLVAWTRALAQPDQPSEALLLSAHCQHIRRWERPRSDYPEGLKHYKACSLEVVSVSQSC